MGAADLTVLFLYFAVIAMVGLWAGRREKSTEDYFLGGRQQHWLPVALSIVATEVSALTFIMVPQDSFDGDWNYLQMYVGSFIGRVLIVLFLLPAFYGGAVTTVYEYLGQRFGLATRTTASLFFLTSRVIGSGIRLLAASMAIAIVFDWPLVWVIVISAGIATAYTTFGGIKAIIWTDVLQALIFLGAGVVAVLLLLDAAPGSWSQNLQGAYEAGKFHTFTLEGGPNCEKLFWLLVVSATFQNMAALGTDQDLTQRMLTCSDLRRGQRALMFNAVVGLPVVCLFLLVGTLLSVFYAGGSAVPVGEDGTAPSVFPYFIANGLPVGVGLKGFFVVAIFAAAMSSVDSALGAISSTAVTDLYRVFVRPSASEKHYVLVARCVTFLAGVTVAAVAIAFSSHDDLLWETFRWVGLIFGGMLGVFLLGVLTRGRGGDAGNVAAMLSSVAMLAGIKWHQAHFNVVYVAWPWWVVVGTVWTFGMGAMFRSRVKQGTPVTEG
jgi:SSS family transporter